MVATATTASTTALLLRHIFFFRRCNNQENNDSSTSTTTSSISLPYDFSHQLSIRYNYKHARYEHQSSQNGHKSSSLIQESSLSQFGVPITTLPRISISGYSERIPAILCMLKRAFVATDGSQTLHVFRENPSVVLRDETLQRINDGTFDIRLHASDVLVIADLIKRWFRLLPTSILSSVDISYDDDSSVEEYVVKTVGSVKSSVLFWVIDFLLEYVVAFESVNQMGINSIAVVMAPNLYYKEDDEKLDMIEAVNAARFSVRFVTMLFESRAKRKHQVI